MSNNKKSLMDQLREVSASSDIDRLIESAKQIIPDAINEMDNLDLVYHVRWHATEMACDATLMRDIAEQLFAEKSQVNSNDAKAIQLLMALVQGMFAAHDVVQDQKPPKNEIDSYKFYMRKLEETLARNNIQMEQDLFDIIDRLAKAVIVHGTEFDFATNKTAMLKFLESNAAADPEIEKTLNHDPLLGLFALTASIMDTNRMSFLAKMRKQDRTYGSAFAGQYKALRANPILATLSEVKKRQKRSVKEKAADIEKKMSTTSKSGADAFNVTFAQLLGQNGRIIFEFTRMALTPPVSKQLLDKVVSWIKSNDQKSSFNDKFDDTEVNELYKFIMAKMQREELVFAGKMAKAEIKADTLREVFKAKFHTRVDVMQGYQEKVWENYTRQATLVVEKIDADVKQAASSSQAMTLKREFVAGFVDIMKYQPGLFLANSYVTERKRSSLSGTVGI